MVEKWGDGIFRRVSCVAATCQKALPALPAHNTCAQHAQTHNAHGHTTWKTQPFETKGPTHVSALLEV